MGIYKDATELGKHIVTILFLIWGRM